MPYFPEAPPASAIDPAPDFAQFVARYRDVVPATRRFIYLNHASVGPLSDWVVAAVNENLDQQRMSDTVIQHGWFDGWRLARQRCAELCNRPAASAASRGEVCLEASTYEGLVRAFNALPLGRGDEAICPADEFPSVYHALTELRSREVALRSIPSVQGDGIVRTVDVLNAITPVTKLIAISWVNFFHGYRHDLEALGKVCRDRGIWLAVDAIQGLGQLALDAGATGAHFISSQGAKWLSAPLGSGFLWASPDVPPEVTPRTEGWFGMELNHDSYTDRTVKPKTNANRFAAGTVPLPSAYGLRRACEVILEAGPARCETSAVGHADRIDDAARELGIPVLSDRRDASGNFATQRSAIISLRVEGVPQLVDELRAADAVFSVREGALRFSPHWYNTAEEIEQVCGILARANKNALAGVR